MSRRVKILIGAVVGLALGAAFGRLAGALVRSDNVPFFVVFGALAGIWGGLVWARFLRPLVLTAIGLAALLLIAVVFTPPRVRFEAPIPVTSPTAQPDGLTADQAATLSSLKKVDNYPLYTMRYIGTPRISEAGEASETSPVFACSLFAALGDPHDRLFGRNFDWRYSPALLLFTDRPAAGGYASVSMVDIAYLGFDDRSVDLTTLPLAERRGLLDAPSWPFDGMNEAGVAVGMAAVPSADARHDSGKPTIDSLEVMRAILDRAGSVDEAVAILGQYNVDWEGGPPLHYLVADRSGRAVLVEFHGGQIIVVPNTGPWHAATNFTRSAVAGDAAGQCHRFDTLVRRLTGAAVPSLRDALDLLKSVAQTESATQWSVVYDMSTGQVNVVMGRTYSRCTGFGLGSEVNETTTPLVLSQQAFRGGDCFAKARMTLLEMWVITGVHRLTIPRSGYDKDAVRPGDTPR